MHNEHPGDRYTFTDTDKTTIHRVDKHGKPDMDGASWKVLSALDDTYLVYQNQADLSRPCVVVVLPKNCFIE